MSESLNNRAAAIRDYLSKIEPALDPTLVYKVSVIASRWEAVRLLIDRGNATPADDMRFSELSAVLRALTKKIGVDACTAESRGPDDIVGITGYRGFLPRDPQRLFNGETWQTAAESWWSVSVGLCMFGIGSAGVGASVRRWIRGTWHRTLAGLSSWPSTTRCPSQSSSESL